MEENVTRRQNTERNFTKINIEDTFEISKEDFEKLSIRNKFSAMWNQQYIDLPMFKYSYLTGILFFIFLSLSEIFILRNYIINTVFDEPETRYWYKVLCFYLYYIATAHWLCVQFYNSYWTPNSQDQIALQNKTLWEDYEESLKAIQKKRILDQAAIKPTKYINRMLDYLPEEITGLRWRFCVICQFDSPPRAHHCVVCNKCILKRDHHCYITGRCIGYWNQRYFYFLCLFSFINSLIGIVSEAYYIIHYTQIGLNSKWSSLILFKSIYMWLWTGELEFHLFIIILHLYIFPIIGAMCFGFVCLQTFAILKGVTSDEFKRVEDIKINFGFIQRWQDVFGPYWILNFLMPSQILFQPIGNGIDWPGIVNLKGLSSLKQYN